MERLERRIAHFMPLTQNDGRPISNFLVTADAAGLLAVDHFNQRSDNVVPNLSKLLADCNQTLTIDMWNDELSASRILHDLKRYFKHPETLAGVVGGSTSSLSEITGTVTGAYRMPQVSSLTSAGHLPSYATKSLARTAINSQIESKGAVLYIQQALQLSHVGVIYVRDKYGESSYRAFKEAADQAQIGVFETSYRELDDASIHKALKTLSEIGVRYVYGILQLGSFQKVLEYSFGMKFVWLLPSMYQFAGKRFKLPKQQNLWRTIDGSAIIGVEFPQHQLLDKDLESLATDSGFQERYISSHPEPIKGLNLTEHVPVVSPFAYTTYDAVMTLGIASCKSNSSSQYFDAIEFQGASGRVAFDGGGSRISEPVNVTVTNIFVDHDLSDDEFIVFQSQRTAVISKINELKEINAFVYKNGSLAQPPSIPPVEQNFNLIPIGILILAWLLSILIMSVCVVSGIWVYRLRDESHVRAAQPTFLGVMLLGIFLMASSIITTTFQEPTPRNILNLFCMMSPWLFVTGFSTAISAVMVKTRRIQFVFRNALAMNRVQIRPRDVMLPFFVLTGCNVFVLSLWSAIAPYRWNRYPSGASNDLFGRPTESCGGCQGQKGPNGEDGTLPFVIVICALNILGVIVTSYQIYATRQMPADFNDSFYFVLALALTVEAFLLGLPIRFYHTDPKVHHVALTLLIVMVCLAFLGPMILPKLHHARKESKRKRANVSNQWGSYISHVSQLDVSHHSEGSGQSGSKSRSKSMHRAFSVKSGSSKSTDGAKLASSIDELRANIRRKTIVQMQSASYRVPPPPKLVAASSDQAPMNHGGELTRRRMLKRASWSYSTRQDMGTGVPLLLETRGNGTSSNRSLESQWGEIDESVHTRRPSYGIETPALSDRHLGAQCDYGESIQTTRRPSFGIETPFLSDQHLEPPGEVIPIEEEYKEEEQNERILFQNEQIWERPEGRAPLHRTQSLERPRKSLERPERFCLYEQLSVKSLDSRKKKKEKRNRAHKFNRYHDEEYDYNYMHIYRRDDG